MPRLLIAAACAAWLAAVPLSVSAASSDAQAVADAYADLTVFVLNVAAGHDGESQQPDRERAFTAALAEQFLVDYAGLSGVDQDALASLRVLDDELRLIWPNVPVEQRLAMRDQWAAQVQESLAGAPCDVYDAMVRAQLVPSFGHYQQPNIDRLRKCWQDHPELTRDGDARPAVLR